MKKTLFPLLFAAFALIAKAQESPLQLNFKISYSYLHQQPGYEYRLENHQLHRKTIPYSERVENPVYELDSVTVDTAQYAEIQRFVNENCKKDKYFGVCRALSPVYAHIELRQDGKYWQLTYAPCRTEVLVEPFLSFGALLDKMLE